MTFINFPNILSYTAYKKSINLRHNKYYYIIIREFQNNNTLPLPRGSCTPDMASSTELFPEL